MVLDWAHHNTKIRAIVYKNDRNFRCLTGFTFFFWLTAMSVVHMNHWLTCCCVEDYGLMRALFDGTVCNMFWRVSKYDSCVQMEIMFGKKAWEWPNIWYLYPWMRSQFGFIIRYLITGIPFFLWSRFRHDILFSYWECPDPEDSDSFFFIWKKIKEQNNRPVIIGRVVCWFLMPNCTYFLGKKNVTLEFLVTCHIFRFVYNFVVLMSYVDQFIYICLF